MLHVLSLIALLATTPAIMPESPAPEKTVKYKMACATVDHLAILLETFDIDNAKATAMVRDDVCTLFPAEHVFEVFPGSPVYRDVKRSLVIVLVKDVSPERPNTYLYATFGVDDYEKIKADDDCHL